MGAVRHLFLLLLLASLAACAGFRPVAPAPQRVFAGERSAIELREPPPEGTKPSWLPGDGSPAIEARVLEHAWQRPGVYRVTVEGSGGSDSFEVEVEPRPVLRAIPTNVRAAIALPDAWSRIGRYVDLATRFAPESDVARTLVALREKLGADPATPAELVEVGIDPAEGIGLVSFDFDPNAAWILVGILDEEKALATMRRLFGLESVFLISRDAGDLYDGIAAGGERQTFGLVGGYLAIRGNEGTGLALAGRGRPAALAAVGTAYAPAVDAQTPGILERAMQAFASAGAGLGGSERFRAARAMAPGDDLLLYAQAPGASGEPLPVVLGVELGDESLLASYGVPMAPEAIASVRAVLGARTPPSAALGSYPGGAVSFLALSFDPAAAFTEIFPDGMQRAVLAAAAAQATGVPLDRLLASFTGNLSAGLYFDPAAFTQIAAVLITGGSPGDDAVPPLFARFELAAGGQETVERALAAATQRTADGWWQRGPVFFRPGAGVLEIATLRARHLRPKPVGTADFRPVLPQEAGSQTLYVDVAGILERLRDSAAESAEAAVVRTVLLEELAFLEPIRALLLQGRMTPEGPAGSLRIDLQPLE